MLKPEEVWNSRTQALIGNEAVNILQAAHIAIFGLGGVGSYVAEALCRAGVGSFLLVDNDCIAQSNINRQLFALHSTLGLLKTHCAKKRLQDINPDINVREYPVFYNEQTAADVHKALKHCDYIIDAIDTVSAKLLLIEESQKLSIPIISCMGTGNKTDPARFEISDIYKTSVCPLARVMRHELKKRHIKKLKVLYSQENPIKNRPPASISFVPSVAGLLIASEVVHDIAIKSKENL
ncbi:MAG: tRNA threonylcarbamoyladenosine dehydratase [Spirochaetales bacterium]